MYKTGHYGAALLVYAPVGLLIAATDPSLALLGGIGTVALSRLPDYDLQVPFVSHRGVTHTLLFAIVVSGLLAAAGWTFGDAFGVVPGRMAALGVVVGITAVGSHLLADALTPAGVPLLWPASSRRFTVAVARASNPLANYGLLVLGVAVTIGLAFFVGEI